MYIIQIEKKKIRTFQIYVICLKYDQITNYCIAAQKKKT